MKYKKFKFPLFLHGDDPDGDGSKAGFVYPLLVFKTPADARAVRKAIKRFMRVRFNRSITSQQARDIFNEGKKFMDQFITEAGSVELTDEDSTMDAIMRAQRAFEEKYKDKIKPLT